MTGRIEAIAHALKLLEEDAARVDVKNDNELIKAYRIGQKVRIDIE